MDIKSLKKVFEKKYYYKTFEFFQDYDKEIENLKISYECVMEWQDEAYRKDERNTYDIDERVNIFTHFLNRKNKVNIESIIKRFNYLLDNGENGKSFFEILFEKEYNSLQYKGDFAPEILIQDLNSGYASNASRCTWFVNDTEFCGLIPFCYFEGYIDYYLEFIKIAKKVNEKIKECKFIQNEELHFFLVNEQLLDRFNISHSIKKIGKIDHDYVDIYSSPNYIPKTLFELKIIWHNGNVYGNEFYERYKQSFDFLRITEEDFYKDFSLYGFRNKENRKTLSETFD